MTDDRKRHQIALVVFADIEGVDASDAEGIGRHMMRKLLREHSNRLTASATPNVAEDPVSWELHVHAVEALNTAVTNGYLHVEPTLRAARRGPWRDTLDDD